VSPQIWWFASRATGVVAWILATTSVVWGLALATRALGKQPRAPWLLDLHRHLGGLTVLFVLAHMGALWADSFVELGPRELLVPMASAWKPEPVTWGVIGLYMLLGVELTSLVKHRMPKRLWHAVHLVSYLAWVASTVHFLRAGTDAKLFLVQGLCLIGLSALVFFLLYRWIGPGRAVSVKGAPSTGAAPRPRAASTERVPALARERLGERGTPSSGSAEKGLTT